MRDPPWDGRCDARIQAKSRGVRFVNSMWIVAEAYKTVDNFDAEHVYEDLVATGMQPPRVESFIGWAYEVGLLPRQLPQRTRRSRGEGLAVCDKKASVTAARVTVAFVDAHASECPLEPDTFGRSAMFDQRNRRGQRGNPSLVGLGAGEACDGSHKLRAVQVQGVLQ